MEALVARYKWKPSAKVFLNIFYDAAHVLMGSVDLITFLARASARYLDGWS